MKLPAFILRIKKRHMFAVYVLVGSTFIFSSISVVTFRVSERVEQQAKLSTWMLSHFASTYLAQGTQDGLTDVLSRTRELDVPFIVTDNRDRPLLWNGPVIGIPMPDQQLKLLSVNPEGGNDPDIDRILELIKKYDSINEPFAVLHPQTGQRMLTLHYGPSALSRYVRWLPYGEFALLAVFFLLIVWAMNVKRVGDQQRLFAGMAKETAHQMGTPLSSILGWLALLRDGDCKTEVLDELDRDVERLGRVSTRFSQIGSKPLIKSGDIASTVDAAVAYFQRRLPHLGGGYTLERTGELKSGCRYNRDLMEWVLENLIKNGIDAMKDGHGAISIDLYNGEGGSVCIRVRDTGTGIPSKHRNRIFEPGYTTKDRGWGMGLALVRRIIVNYHQGRIVVDKTGPSGTTFLITLPGEGATDVI
jgi:signal transduction histidine kinase